MIALLGGLGAAICFAVSTLGSARSSRLIGAPAVVGWMMLVGLLFTLPLFPLTGALTATVTPFDGGLLLLAGLTNIVGLISEYGALRVGRVGLVVGLVSAEGAVAAVIAILGGQAVTVGAAIALAVVGGGVVVIGLASEDHGARSSNPGLATLLALVAAGCFGLNLVVIGRLGADLPFAWALMAARVFGVVAVTVPLLLLRRLRLSRAALPLVIASGVAEVVGQLSFLRGAQANLAVSSILVSQFATISAVAAYFLFHERLTRVQAAGVVAVVGGVCALALLQG
ncbi:MAG: EamA family transporter [Candidatus Limnocylindrales bacterium]